MLVGILVAGVIPAAAAATGAGSISALAITGWGIVVAGAVVFPLLLLTVAEPAPRPLQGRDPLLPSIRDLTSNGPFNRLLLGWFVNSLANGIPSVLFILFMKHVIGANEITQGLFTLLYFLAGIVGMPLWIWLSRRHSKHRIWCVAMVLASTAFATVPALEAGDILLFGIIVLLTGFCLGADLALPPAMQADVAEYEYFRKGRDRTGIMFAAWSMSTKLALAASVGIALPMLDWLGTPEQGSTEKYDSMTLALIYAGLPVVLKIGVTLLIWGYPLNKAKLAIIQRRLGTRIKDPSG
jgi:Na+/melibiose symporter-like transporter